MTWTKQYDIITNEVSQKLSVIRLLLLFVLFFFLMMAAMWPLVFGFPPTPSISSENQLVVNRILADYGDDLGRFPLVLRVTFEGVKTISAREKMFYFKGYTWFGIPWKKARVSSIDDQVQWGQVIDAWKEFD